MKKRKNLIFIACISVIIIYLFEKAFVPDTFGKIYKSMRKGFKNEIKRKRNSGLNEFSVDIFVNTKKPIQPFSADMPRG